MTNLIDNLPHLLIALAVVAVAATLGALRVIDASTTVALIGGASGVSIGLGANNSPSSGTTAAANPRQNVS